MQHATEGVRDVDETEKTRYEIVSRITSQHHPGISISTYRQLSRLEFRLNKNINVNV